MPDHSWEYRKRRALNWFVLGLTYATFYMGRYNINIVNANLQDPDHFGWTKDFAGFWLGTIPFGFVYGASVLLNGAIADRLGGKKTMLLGGLGSILANVFLGVLCMLDLRADQHAIHYFCAGVVVNCYFQSFGALSVVKLNAPWFHVTERGTFGGIFGWMFQ